MKGENNKFKHPIKTNRLLRPSTKSPLLFSFTNSFLTCPLRSNKYAMRQYLKFHSRDLVNVSPPRVRYFLSPPLEFDVGSSVDGAMNFVGMCGAIE